MKSKKILIILGGVLVVGGAGVFWFVTRPKNVLEEAVESNAADTAGLANPASVYCEQQGGTLQNETTEEGTRGICILPDGTECGQWSYFYGRCFASDGSGYGTFQTEDDQFSFDYPANWTRAEDLNLEEVFSTEFVDQYSFSMPLLLSDPQGAQISLSIYHFDEDIDLETAMDALEEELEKIGKPYSEISREASGDSLVADSTTDEQGTAIQVRDILYLSQEGVVYNLSLAAPKETLEEYDQLFSHIKSSVKFPL